MKFLYLLAMVPALLLANRVVVQQAIEAEAPSKPNELHGDCQALYKAMVGQCEKQPTQPAFNATGWQNCSAAMSELWFNTSLSFTKAQYRWLFKSFINHTGMQRKQVLTPVFWAGFSHTTGTRPVMDEMIQILPDCDGKPFLCSDIEHESSPLGQILRANRWHRQCHRSGEDRQVWVRLSETFSFRRQEVQSQLGVFEAHLNLADVPEDNAGLILGKETIMSHIESNKVVHILLNKNIQMLKTTFLFEYELPLLAAATSTPNLQFWSFKTDCGENFKQLVPAKLRLGTSCTSLADFSLRDSPPEAHLKKLAHLKWKLLCLESNFIFARDGQVNHTAQIECCNQGQTTFLQSGSGYRTTALHLASRLGHLETVKFLANEFPTLVNMTNGMFWGDTALGVAKTDAVKNFLANFNWTVLEQLQG
eukprot:TRINITY_DN13685_c0_g1_i3.p1 TRINITY_DN13685_c0_g1~~TRINITY_DN13685_c0_g1_i3.p1  ORF type:complete len:421 (-),score=62.00 TRINITY_DN13685_c0_g1_i3:404-1666(-)